MITQEALLQFLGRLHPLVLHLPIGLWIGIALLEFGGAIIRRRAPRATIATLAWLAAIGGAFTAAAGWLLSLEDGYSGRTLELHRWLGVAAGIAGLLGAAVAGLQTRRPFQLLLLVEMGLLTAAGHLGSEMTHGEKWLLEPFQEQKREKQPDKPVASTPPIAPTNGNAPAAAPTATPTTPAASTATAATFAKHVLPILEQRCTKCHGESKQKGDLALHTAAAIEKGGENGAVLVAGNAEQSELVRRLLLPLDDDDRMPPKDKPQPNADEVRMLRAWIQSGASFTAEFSPAVPTSTFGPLPEVRQAAPQQAETQKAVPPESKAPKDEPKAETVKPATPTVEPQQPEPPKSEPAPTPTPTPKPAEPAQPRSGGGGGAETAAATIAGDDEPKATTPARTAAIAALKQRFVHVAPVAEGEPGLWIDFAPIAPTTTEAEARTLLQPVLAEVRELGLARVPAGDDLVALCARMPQLERLDLRRTRTTSRGLRALAGHPRLAQLVLAETSLDAAAVDALLAMPALRRVHVWECGLDASSIARLRAHTGLEVVTGEAVEATAAALETEPPVPGTPAAAAAAPAPTGPLAPINDVCPVSGKPVDPRFVVVHEQKAIGFCCPNCPKPFWAEPAKYPISRR